MVNGDFGHFQLPVAAGFSDGQFDLVVKALHNSAVELLLRLEPVENQFAMVADASSHRIDWFQSAPHHPFGPAIQELAGPVR